MGNGSSVSMAYSDEDPSANQVQSSRDGHESRTLIEDLNETGEGEGREECGLCRYIKGGECKDAFIELEKCVDEAEKNGESDLTECKKLRVMFKTCMYDNPGYYEPILAGEARAIAKVLIDLQAEKEAILAGDVATIARAVSRLQTEEAPVLPAEAAAIAMAFQELEAEKQVGKAETN